MTKRKTDTYRFIPNEAISVCYVSDSAGQEPFIHILPNRVIEPWHFKSLTGSTSVLMVLPLGFDHA